MRTPKTILIISAITLTVGFATIPIDKLLQRVIREHKLKAYQPVPEEEPAKRELGRLLFFDKELSGNRDISCATCHHPGANSGDNLPLAIGVGGNGLAKERTMGEGRSRIPRNSPEIFNRGADEWHTLFWDGRVAGDHEKGFTTPADEKFPDGIENVLAAQAMFPVFSRDEMRGEIGDQDIFGNENELALISNARPQSVWAALMKRILRFPQYRQLFKQAYPAIPEEELGFEHAANAIAHFETSAFTFTNSPWDRYLNGDKNALSETAKRGALLFYGKAKCAECHSGNLLTDQLFHNIGIPQFGPGKEKAAPLDAGRYAETGKPEDKFAFRTPPLRNVSITGPWMHNGAYTSLQGAIRHHLDPENELKGYDVSQLEPQLRASYKNDPSVHDKVLQTLDSRLEEPISISDSEINELVAFMDALTDPDALNLDYLTPDEVPSGLPVEELTLEQRKTINSKGY